MGKKLGFLIGLVAGAALAYKKKQEQFIIPSDASKIQDQYAMVTGASTGIGKAITEVLAKSGAYVFATVRKQADAVALESLSEKIIPIIMDVADHDSVVKAREKVAETLGEKRLFALVNNAGVAVPGPLEKLPLKDFKYQFDVNVFGLLDTTQIFFDLLNIKNSKIINISSVGGVQTMPFIGAYSASKHALEAISDAMRRELLLANTGVDVIVIQPGSIKTPIWNKAKETDMSVFEGTRYGDLGRRLQKAVAEEEKAGADVEKVANTVLGIVLRSNNQARYIVSDNWAKEVYVPRTLPDRMFDRLIQKMMAGSFKS